MTITLTLIEVLGVAAAVATFMRKTNQISVRLPEELMKELEEACTLTGLDPTTITRACLQAFVDEVSKTGQISLPLAIVPKNAQSPPGKTPASAEQRIGGRMDAEAARAGSRPLGSAQSSHPGMNEEPPVELKPAIPAREKTSEKPATRARQALQEMQKRETKSNS